MQSYTADIEMVKKRIRALEKKKRKVNQKIKDIGREVNSKVEVSPALRAEMAQHIKPIFEMLWLAKDILESKLDASLMRVRSVPRIDEANYQPEAWVQKGLFLTQTVQDIQQQLAKKREEEGIEQSEKSAKREQQIMLATGLFQQFLAHRDEMAKGEAVDSMYDKYLQGAQEEFQKAMEGIDAKMEFLHEVLRKLNASASQEEIVESLLMLSGIDKKRLSREDWDSFLQGNGTMEI